MMEWTTLYVVLGLIVNEVGEAQNARVGNKPFGAGERLLAIFAWPFVLGIALHEAFRE